MVESNDLDPNRIQDLFSLRNAVLLLKQLKKERIREVYIVMNGFQVFADKYPFMCKYRGAELYPKPLLGKTYPSEILTGRMYLGDQFHAQDYDVLKQLGVTHVLNATDMLPNFFENSPQLDLQYMRVNIADEHHV